MLNVEFIIMEALLQFAMLVTSKNRKSAIFSKVYMKYFRQILLRENKTKLFYYQRGGGYHTWQIGTFYRVPGTGDSVSISPFFFACLCVHPVFVRDVHLGQADIAIGMDKQSKYNEDEDENENEDGARIRMMMMKRTKQNRTEQNRTKGLKQID